MASSPDFTDQQNWDVTPDVAVFDTHEDRAKSGKLVRKFTKEDLEEIARRCNSRDHRGQPCPLTIGHTRNNVAESEQPEIVGYARNFRVKYDSRLGRHTIRADYFIRRDKVSKAKGFPRTSVELWPDDKFFDPIALIRRTPRRDVGQWTYGKPVMHNGKTPAARPIRYAMGDEDTAEEYEDEGKDKKPDPTAPPDDRDPDRDAPREEKEETNPYGDPPDGVEPEFHSKVMQCVRAGHGPLMEELMKDPKHRLIMRKFMADDDDAEDGDVPASETEPDQEPDQEPEEGARKMSRADDPIKYRKIEAENQHLKRENEKLKRGIRRAERLGTLEKYVRAGIKLDPQEELRDWGDVPDEQWKKHCDRIVHHYERDITSDTDIQIPTGDDPTDFGSEPNERQNDQALKYMRAHNLTGPDAYERALAIVRGTAQGTTARRGA